MDKSVKILMARKPTGNPVGCPEKQIDWTLFEQLCSIQCTQSEMASMLKVHPDTLRDHVKDHYGEEFSTVYIKYSETGKCSLRRNQFVLSKTNTAMAIWLGKQWLGQKEPENKSTEWSPEKLLALSEFFKAAASKTHASDTKSSEDHKNSAEQ